ncbi:LytR/AlgR family response regulator transcription factor [Adhaeribacter pallidiroseus]|uniref:HTH LytTR-type domain-containing protein n=1 Tax=Adhaeribacter pallidiroseus TaxID=2072847 RepID=A0A369QFT9_9BACT|nr:LytTR family DNA-binding domain-containing protein [Adhaeribacter pallidiroseus]RDC63783.1 hypothetical protein AHMF7616_02392 [Adhaeribacter pallidiroseus]
MPANTPDRPLPVYRDAWIKYLGVPVITAFAYYLTYDHVEFNGWFIYEILSDAFKIFLVWHVVRLVIVYLDKVLAYQNHLTKRLLVQTLATGLVGVVALSVLVYLDYALVRPYQINHYWSLDVVIALIFILFINGIYVALYFYDSYVTSVAENKSMEKNLEAQIEKGQSEYYLREPTTSREQLLVKVGRKDVVVPYVEICCIYSRDKETYLLTADHKTYLHDFSLDRLEEQLPTSQFFRANRKFIITPELVRTISTEAHGKLQVYLKPYSSLPATVTISREKAPLFRRWLKR